MTQQERVLLVIDHQIKVTSDRLEKLEIESKYPQLIKKEELVK